MLTLESQTGATATASDTTPTGATGCDQVPFTPTLTVTPGTTKRDSPTGGSVNLHVPSLMRPTGVESSHVKTTAITLPEGVTLNPSGGERPAGVHRRRSSPRALMIRSPAPTRRRSAPSRSSRPSLAAPLTGSLWVGQPQDQDPYRLFLRATGPSGLDVRLKGSVAADPVTGRLTATFADTPQTPFTDFTLTFNGGPRATLATPLDMRRRGDDQLDHAVQRRTAAPATPTSSFTVDGDGVGRRLRPVAVHARLLRLDELARRPAATRRSR